MAKERGRVKESERTCAGCRQKASVQEFERFVLLGGDLVYDMRSKAPGRGAHVHAMRECLQQACYGGFARAFRQRIEAPPLDELMAQVCHGIELRRMEAFGVARRTRSLSVGQDAVKEAMRRREIEVLLVARDAGVSTRDKYVANAERIGIKVIEGLDGSVLGTVSGREFVAVLGICDTLSGQRVLQDTHKLQALML